MECSQSTSSYEIRKLLTQELEALGLEIKNVKECANKIVLNMKCTRKIAYSNFVKEGGQISIISRILFSHVPASFLILSAYLDTNFVNDSVSGQGKVLYYLEKLALSSKIFNLSIIIHSENSYCDSFIKIINFYMLFFIDLITFFPFFLRFGILLESVVKGFGCIGHWQVLKNRHGDVRRKRFLFDEKRRRCQD